MRTYTPKPGDVRRTWHVVDAEDLVLGRLSTQVARLLKGKHKPTYTPHVDTGDFVIVVNAGKVAMTGNKRVQSLYRRHSGYPGSLKETTYDEMLRTRPQVIVEKAIKGMLPHTSLGRAMGRKLKVYAGPDHPHAAQQPVAYTLNALSQ